MRKTKKTFIAMSVMIGMLFGLCAASVPALAAPYGPGFHCTSKLVAPAGHHKFYRIITKCTYQGQKYRSVIVIHSKPVVLGTMTSNAAGVATGEFDIPAGFKGDHTIEIDRMSAVSTNKPAVTETVKATTTNVLMPITIGKTTFAEGSSLLPTTSSDDGYSGLVVIGIGALGVVMLTGGGLLMFANRRRKVLA